MWFTFSLLTPIMFVDDPKSTDVPPNPVSLSLPLYDLPQSCLSLPLSDAETQAPVSSTPMAMTCTLVL